MKTTAIVCDIPTVRDATSLSDTIADNGPPTVAGTKAAGHVPTRSCGFCRNCGHDVESGSGEWLAPLIPIDPLLRPEPYSVAWAAEAPKVVADMGVL